MTTATVQPRGSHLPWRAIGRRLRGLVIQLAVLAGTLAVWEFATQQADEAYFPPPSEFFPRMHELWFSGPAGHLFLTSEAMSNFLPSLAKLGAGWAIAAVIGILVGLAIGRSTLLMQFLDPVLALGRSIPPPTLIPFFIVVPNTTDGVSSVDRLQMDTARVFNLTGPQRLFRLILPSSAPKIFAGLRLSVSIALILMVIAELMGGGTGIGEQLVTAQRTFDLSAMWGVIVILGVLGYLLNAVFLIVERRSLRWYRGARPTEPL